MNAPASDAVLAVDPRAPRWMRRGLQATARFAPSLAVRLALRLFFTPLPSKLAARARPLPAGWRRTMLPFESGRIAVWTFDENGDSARPRVLLMHGWAGHAQQMQRLAEALHLRGFAPVLLEAPGHGHSDGWRSTLPQFVRALFTLQARQGPWHAVVGHSLGAMAVVHAAAQQLGAGRLVLVAPPPPPAAVVNGFAAAFGLGASLAARMRARIERREGVPMARFELPWLRERVAQPTLVVHDRDDRVNRFADGVAYRDAIAGAELVATQDLGHRRILREPTVLQQVSAFISKA
jgi:pimeloyl-ACP methyl ester carboxylesterase